MTLRPSNSNSSHLVQVAKRSFLTEAYSNLKRAEDVRPSINSTYNIACVCALSGRREEAQVFI